MKYAKYANSMFMVCTIFFISTLLTYPSSARGENLLENSSFEVGAGHGWGTISNHKTSGPLDHHIDTTMGYHSNSSLKLEFYDQENSQGVISRIYRLKPETQYTVSLYAKSDFSAAVFNIQVKNTFEGDYGPGDIHGYSFRASNDWQRFSFTFTTTTDAEKSSYQINFAPAHQSVPGKYIWIDAIQLEEGSLTPYSPKATVEIGLVSDHKGNVFFEDEPIIFKLKQSALKNANAHFEVYDYYNQKVKEVNINTKSLSEQDLDLTLAKNKRGAFRVIFWVEGRDGAMGEVNYSVLPRPRTLGIDEGSIFGAHVPFKEYYLSIMQKVGVKWNRTLSTGRQFRWKLVEPTKGNFIWKDEQIALAAKYGMKVLGTIGSEVVHVPDWAKDADGLPKLDDWYNFVFAVVDHYKDLVDYWEIWNEPDTEGGLGSNPEFYGQLLKTAYTAAKSADPDAMVVGMVAYYAPYVDKVFNAIGDRYCDIVSTHRYPPINFQHLSDYFDVISTHGNKPVWNSETGMKTDSFYQTLLWEDLWGSYAQPDAWTRDYRIRTNKLIWNFAHTVGRGMKKYFYYDARQTTAPDFLITYSLFEWDQTLKPKAVAYSILAHLFDGSEGQGVVNLDPDTYAYLFLRGSTPLIILWAKDSNDVKLLNISSISIKAYDVMGNELSISNGLTFGRSPIYIEGQGITQEQLISSLSISATNDTNPPNLSIVTFPTGPTNGDRVLFRWFAFDDTSVSTRWENTSESIVYSYKLDGYDSDWSNWITTTSNSYYNIPEGNYTFKVKAKDVAGNIANVSVSVSISSDTMPPAAAGSLKKENKK